MQGTNNLDLASAVQFTQSFRNRMNSGELPYKVPVQSYFLDKTAIMDLLNQNDGNITGLKIYFAEKNNDNNDPLLYLVVVATHRIYEGESFTDDNDFGIPENFPEAGMTESTADITTTSAVFRDPRPCPPQCGIKNCLNTP